MSAQRFPSLEKVTKAVMLQHGTSDKLVRLEVDKVGVVPGASWRVVHTDTPGPVLSATCYNATAVVPGRPRGKIHGPYGPMAETLLDACKAQCAETAPKKEVA